MSRAEEARWVEQLVSRVLAGEARLAPSDAELLDRARELSLSYLGGRAQPASVRWVDNMRSRWGSCTPLHRSIRLSMRLQTMPTWVVDYVLVHELAHLLEPRHDASFWAWVERYPLTEKAKGYLLGWSHGAAITPPDEFADVEPPA